MTGQPTRRAVLLGGAVALAGVRVSWAQDEDPLVAALRAEHAAIYAYGALSAPLPERIKELCRVVIAEHRLHRDGLETALRARGVTPPAAEPAYALPSDAPGNAAEALAALAVVEDALIHHWHDAVGREADATLRRQCATWLGEETRTTPRCATCATRPSPSTSGSPASNPPPHVHVTRLSG